MISCESFSADARRLPRLFFFRSVPVFSTARFRLPLLGSLLHHVSPSASSCFPRDHFATAAADAPPRQPVFLLRRFAVVGRQPSHASLSAAPRSCSAASSSSPEHAQAAKRIGEGDAPFYSPDDPPLPSPLRFSSFSSSSSASRCAFLSSSQTRAARHTMSRLPSADAAASARAASAQQQQEQRRSAAVGAAGDTEKTQRTQPEEGDAEKLTGAELQAALHRIDREKLVVSNKILELQQDLSEHRVVLEAFGKVENTRACFRMVGGVLVQRTVAEVQPVLEAHKQKVEAALEELEKELNFLTQKQTDYSRRYLQATGQDLQSAWAGSSGSRGDGDKGTGDETQQQQQRVAGGAGILV